MNRPQPIVESHDLSAATRDFISHDGAIYRMKITRQGQADF
ncbi:hemin uptake protein HemP [Sinorhizobium meliloti]|nr:hemin uptake protein HemP [Sinorhizobium meliloti]